MKVLQLSSSDLVGGAARAAYRIHYALRQAGVDSLMMVDSASSGDWTVQGPVGSVRKGLSLVRPHLAFLYRSFFKTGNPIIHSPSILPSGRVSSLNASDADVLHLHWVQHEMLSIAEIGRLRKPVVWTLHDMWAFCGAEHYTEDYRWRDGYRKNNRPHYEGGFDLNRWVWERKRKHWQCPVQIVTPSRWLADSVRASILMREWSVVVIPNAIDTDRWKPMDPSLARELIGLPKDVPLLLFGTMGHERNLIKGFDLLQAGLRYLRDAVQGLELVVFGQSRPKDPPDMGLPIHYLGHLHDDLSLRALYSSVDVVVIPSRQDNLPNTGVEAMACGTPVVAFDTAGLPDIVEHLRTGYLAKAFDAEDLAAGIVWVLGEAAAGKLRTRARLKAVEKFAYPVVAEAYRAVYQGALG